MAFKLGMAVHLCLVYMLVSMTLTFIQRLGRGIRDIMSMVFQLSTFLRQSIHFLVAWDIAVRGYPLYCCGSGVL